MSSWLLLEATEALLRQQVTAELILNDVGTNKAVNYFGVMPEGRPPPACGEWFVSLDDWDIAASGEQYIEEVYGLRVWISIRTGRYAPDRRKQMYAGTDKRLDPLERFVIRTIHGNYQLINDANTNGGLPDADLGSGFIEPLWYAGRTATRFIGGGEWNDSGNENDNFAVRELRFRGGKRIQDAASWIG